MTRLLVKQSLKQLASFRRSREVGSQVDLHPNQTSKDKASVHAKRDGTEAIDLAVLHLS
jgi:hypothetical protein